MNVSQQQLGSYPYEFPSPFGDAASFGQRLVAYVVDVAVYTVGFLFFSVPYALFVSQDVWGSSVVVVVTRLLFLAGLVGGCFALGFFVFVRPVYRSGQTLGRRIVGIKVIDNRSGRRLTRSLALARVLIGNYVSGSFFYLGYLWMLWDDRQETWHDKLVHSHVVRVR